MKLNIVLLITAISTFIAGCLTLLIPYYMDYRKFSLTEMGVVIAAATATSIIAKLCSGRIADSIGVKYPILVGNFAAIILVFLLPFTRNSWQLTILRLLFGISLGISGPALGSLIAQIGKNNLGETMGKYSMIVATTSSTLGPFAAGYLAFYLPYHISFFVLSFLAAISFILSFFMPTLKSEKTLKNKTERFSFDANVFSSAFFQFSALFLVMIMIIYLAVYTSRIYGKQIASLMALVASIPFLLSPRLGKISENQNKGKFISFGFILYAISFFVLKITFSIPILLFSAFISGAGGAISSPVIYSLGIPGKGKGTRMAILQSSADLGAFFGSLIGGFMANTFGFMNTFILCGIIGSAIAFIAFLLIENPIDKIL